MERIEADLTALEGDNDHLLDRLGAQAVDLVTVILGHTAILATTLSATDERREDVESIAVAARRLAGVMSQVLAAAGGRGVLSQASGDPQRTPPHLLSS